MTIDIFIYLFAIGSAASSLLTQAVKKAFKDVPSNFIALGSSVMVGVGAISAYYIFEEIPIDAKGVFCTILMCACIWVGSMCSYDKVLQMISQFKR